MKESPRGPIRAWWWWPALGGLAIALAYPPVNLLPFAFLGPWGLYAFLDREVEDTAGADGRRAFLGGFLFGCARYGVLLTWIAGLTGFSVMAVPGYLFVALGMAATSDGAAAYATALGRRYGLPTALGLPLAWTAVEWLRSFGDLGLPWAVVGDTLAGWPTLVQPAELGGVWLLSLWVMGLSAAGWRVLRPRPGGRRGPVAAVAVALAAIVPAYGTIRMAGLERASAAWPTFRAAAVQPNVPQDLKWEDEFEREIRRKLVAGTEQAARSGPQLVVWPESALVSYLRYDPLSRALVPALAAQVGAPILTGTLDADTLPGRSGGERDDYVVYNAAYLVREDGIVPGRWAKRRLVPVAERVPFVPQLATGFFERLSAWTGQFAPGREWRTWEVDGVGFGVLICYESIFPDVSRGLVRSGADFLTNITNDAWFGRSAAPYQHASHLTLRAVEHRVSVLRSANTGISGWVDPLGRYRERTPLYEAAVVSAELPIPGITTPYTRWGDWVPLVALWTWGLWALVGAARRRSTGG
ncbi:MAG TPA: apolipoprotein N-acyltransferase [Gemmatimonadota bacterium]|nr:apolipoprotein N-acyltransferase [Gemmatimonadota bacterium]